MNQLKNENWTRTLRGKEISCHKSQITKLQRMKEQVTENIRKRAMEIERMLQEFKEYSDKAMEEVATASLVSGEADQGKSFEFSNFDGSIKVSKDMTQFRIVEPGLFAAGKLAFNDFATNRIVSPEIKSIIDALIESPTAAKINALTRLKPTINDDLFTEAVNFMEAAVTINQLIFHSLKFKSYGIWI